MIKLGILLTNRYRLLSVAAILDVFEMVNKFYIDKGDPVPFEINLFHDKETQRIQNDTLFHGYLLRPVHKSGAHDLIFVPAFNNEDITNAIQENYTNIGWLKHQYESGAGLASFCTGAFLLGATGLLKEKLATTHVDACKAFAAAFPDVNLQPHKTVTQDGRLYTSGGATSSFHLMLHIIQQYCSKAVAVRIAKIFAIDMDRTNQSYFSTFQMSQKPHNDDLVAMAQQKIEMAYHNTTTIEEMIKDIPASRRNIVRRFKQVTGITPIEYLQQIRIAAAKKLLEQTTEQMTEIIFKSGYNDPKAFRKVFRKSVGMTPSEYRGKFYVG